MAIEKNSFKVVSRLDSEVSPRSGDVIMLSDEEDYVQRSTAAVESDDDDDDFDDCDSGAGSDDFDLLELGEAGEEFCQVGDQTCSIPYELYDLPGLHDILSLDVWNDFLSEEERFTLTQFLPDMDQEMFLRTLKDLFTGCNMHFGSPVNKLFDMLKGGLCEPRVALYRQGLNFFQMRQHYHRLRKHQNTMVTNLCQLRDAWSSCKGYSIEEKLRVLNIMKSQKSLMSEKMEEMESESSERESGDGMWGQRGKDRKSGQKVDRYSKYGINSGPEFSSHGKQMALEPAKYGKQNSKAPLKPAGTKTSTGKDLVGRVPSAHHVLNMKSGSLSRQHEPSGYDYVAALQLRNQIPSHDEEEQAIYGMPLQRNQNFSRVGPATKACTFKMGKKRESLMDEEYMDSFNGSPVPWKNDFYGRNKPVNQLADIKVLTAKPSSARAPFDYGKKVKYSEKFQQLGAEDHMTFRKGRILDLSMKGNRMDSADGSGPFYPSGAQREPFAHPSYNSGEWNIKSKKGKSGRESPNVNDRLSLSDHKALPLLEKFKASTFQNGVRDIRGYRSFPKTDETESDSSEQMEEDEDDNPLMRSKWVYPSGRSDLRPGINLGKAQFVKKDKKENIRAFDGPSNSSGKMDGYGEHLDIRIAGNHGMRVEPKGKMHDIGHLNSAVGRNFNDSYLSGSGKFSGGDDWQHLSKSGRNGNLRGGYDERFHLLPLKDRRRKGEFSNEYGDPHSNYLHAYGPEEEDHLLRRPFSGDNGVTSRVGKKGQIVDLNAEKRFEIPEAQLISCNSVTKKRKVKNDFMYMNEKHDKEFLHSDMQIHLDGSDTLSKRGKKKLEDGNENLEKEVSEPPFSEMGGDDVDLDTKPQKKPFTLITPTIHTGFSFSIIHLLSAVRMAMITLLPEDSLDAGNSLDNNEQKPVDKEKQDTSPEGTSKVHPGDADADKSIPSTRVNVPSLAVQEIVNRVRSNPGDPCILETQEPLQDLVRGVLKIFSSKTAPLGAKGWKPLVVYERATKSWSWIGPVNQGSSDQEAIEEVTSPEAWGIAHKMLVKLVDAFANWLKNGQETLQQIGSLPSPPSSLMQYNLDEKERFKDLRAQKSLSTISPSSEEVRDYFRKEEVLRYSIPDRAFAYTAVDGKKSIVAPLRRCGGKPTSKARDHFMLKRDRPPHVTILCLVRDAAARLPGSIGTRADVCTLIRDSQYIVEDVSDSQVNQVVSGALDRLHYERDPCVQFDGERKLWVYLHRQREEEDFEDDGTSSTKKWKRQKKEATEPDQGSVTVAYPGPSEQNGFDSTSDLNIEPQCTDEDKGADLVSNDDGKDNVEASQGSEQGTLVHVPAPVASEQDALHNLPTPMASDQGALHEVPTPMALDAVLNHLQENRFLCQENSTNEDFDDEPFGG